jgi:hypothetical protein
MRIRWHKIYRIFFPALVMVMVAILSVQSASCARKTPQEDVESAAVPGQIAPRLQNLGDHKFIVTTSSPRAQLFMSQGMMLTYGFNHAEASRSFREAARLDPNCAMAYWGMALVLGTNINMAMPPKRTRPKKSNPISMCWRYAIQERLSQIAMPWTAHMLRPCVSCMNGILTISMPPRSTPSRS